MAITAAWPKGIFYDSMTTLLDWRTPGFNAAQSILRKYDSQADPQRFYATWYRLMAAFTLESAFGSGYQDLIERYREALELAMAYHKVPGTGDDVKAMNWDAIQPFPETLDALREQQKFTKVIVFSNAGTEYLRTPMAKLKGFTPDYVNDAQTINMSKPSPRAYNRVLSDNGLRVEDVLYCAAPQWDVQGAMALGMKAVWLNRDGRTLDGIRPDFEAKNLHEVTQIARQNPGKVA